MSAWGQVKWCCAFCMLSVAVHIVSGELIRPQHTCRWRFWRGHFFLLMCMLHYSSFVTFFVILCIVCHKAQSESVKFVFLCLWQLIYIYIYIIKIAKMMEKNAFWISKNKPKQRFPDFKFWNLKRFSFIKIKKWKINWIILKEWKKKSRFTNVIWIKIYNVIWNFFLKK